MSVTFNKTNFFTLDCGSKIHNLTADQLAVAFTDVAPVATNHVLADLTTISLSNISSPNITTTSFLQSSGTAKLILANLTMTATGTVPQFRYVAIYNTTATNKNLIGWFDYGAELNMVVNDTIVITFDQTNGLLTNA